MFYDCDVFAQLLSRFVTMSLQFIPTFRLSITSTFVIFFILHLLFLSIPSIKSNTPNAAVSTDDGTFTVAAKNEFAKKAICFQQRKRTKEQTAKYKAICGDSIIDDFCEHVSGPFYKK